MEFTEFMNESEIDEFKNKIYTATLTGFIQRFPGCSIQNKKGEHLLFNGHYVSITKSLFSKDYFLSDDLNHMEPLNMGPNAIFDKSVPVVWLFIPSLNIWNLMVHVKLMNGSRRIPRT